VIAAPRQRPNRAWVSCLALLAAVASNAWRLRAETPGLPQPEAERACEEMVKLAPEGLDEGELYPCSRD